MNLSQFIEPEDRYKARLLLVFWVLSFLFGTVGLFQTELAVSTLQRPNFPEIRSTMIQDRGLQEDLRKDYHERTGFKPEEGIVFKGFTPQQLATLNIAKNSLLLDKQLQAELMSIYGSSFREINVIVVPCWHM
ncbi:MAG: hypothetical protein M3R52_01985, partial [Acidobacteriota bacterium]|nr:hypothetical protein [Acidobacteriota bacterium]